MRPVYTLEEMARPEGPRYPLEGCKSGHWIEYIKLFV
jgi:hypothetical protein